MGAVPEQGIVPKTWTDEKRGLSKVNLSLDFVSMTKATLLSTVTCVVEEVEGSEAVESDILGKVGQQAHQMGTAETPVDCYIEDFLSQMLIGEVSRCAMRRKSPESKPLEFTIRVIGIENRRHMHQLSPKEVLELASQFKERGVRMFKKWPEHAHVYFGRAHKLLCSYPGQKRLSEYTVEEVDGIDGEVVAGLLNATRHNLAACLLLEKRYEDMIGLLDQPGDAKSEKAMYRKAQALCHLQRHQEALKCFEEIVWQDNPPMASLNATIREKMAREKDEYSTMVKKMFK